MKYLNDCRSQCGDAQLQVQNEDYPLRKPRFYAALFAVLLLVCLQQPAVAANKTVDIYAASVNVADDSEAVRKATVNKALKTIYQRVTGNPYPLKSYPNLRKYLPNAARYLSTYAYQKGDRNDIQEADSLDAVLNAAQPDPLSLALRFDPVAIKQHLRESGAPFWAERRPVVDTVLMVMDGSGSPAMVSRSSGQGELIAQSMIDLQADNLGVPVSGKLARSLDAKKYWSSSAEQLRVAARRSDNAVLFGMIDARNRLRARWVFAWGDILYSENTEAASQDALVRQGIGIAQKQLSARLASRIDNSGSSGSTQRLTIGGVNSLERYFAVIDHLDSVEVMRNYQIIEFSDNLLELQINTQASISSLRSMLSLDRRLAEVAGQSLTYEWR